MNETNKIKSKVRWSCRLEYVGSGYYSKLSDSYKHKSELSDIFRTFAMHELKHGAMFGGYYRKEFGEKLNQNAWITLGKVVAFFQSMLPLKWKLKMLHRLETSAVRDIKSVLCLKERNRYLEILEKILPDEIAHAGLYRELYPA